MKSVLIYFELVLVAKQIYSFIKYIYIYRIKSISQYVHIYITIKTAINTALFKKLTRV